jgi:hypothetical protein
MTITPAELGARILASLRRQAATNQVAGALLRAEIRTAMGLYRGAKPMTAKRVLALMTRRPLPTVRSVQRHMSIICGRSSVCRSRVAHREAQHNDQGEPHAGPHHQR